jgi:hypothetical protein
VVDAIERQDIGYIVFDSDPTHLRVENITACLCQVYREHIEHRNVKLISLAALPTGRPNGSRRIGLIFEEFYPDFGFPDLVISGEIDVFDDIVQYDEFRNRGEGVARGELGAPVSNISSDHTDPDAENKLVPGAYDLDENLDFERDLSRDEDLLDRGDYLPLGWRNDRFRKTISLV